jgi:NTP pyrophosphatase (non-canonical NTP hydrolase)
MKELTLHEYQLRAMDTCMASCNNLSYMLLNLVGEVGEFASKVAKAIRKGKAEIVYNEAMVVVEDNDILLPELQAEAGDILWQLAGLCTVMNWSLEDVAQGNLDKLASRKQRGVIDGNGDYR